MRTTKPTLAQLRSLIGNPEVYAVQRADGGWFPVKEKLGVGILAQHLAGELTAGTYIVRPPDQARTLVFDVDHKDKDEAEKILNSVTQVIDKVGLEYGVEFSGRKGYHVWVIAKESLSAAVLYRLGRGIRDEAGISALEVFPKQVEVRDLGNLVKLPGGIHQVTQKHNDFIDNFPVRNSVEKLFAAAELYPEIVVRSRRRGDPAGIEYPCVYALQEGAPEGGRNVHMFHLATMLRKFSLNDEHVEAIMRATNERSDPPLPDEELDGIIENSRWAGPVCDQLNPEVHCGEQCIKAKHPGLYTRDGAARWAADGEEFVVTVRERADDGRVLELEHPDFVQARAVLVEPKGKSKRWWEREKDDGTEG